MTRTQKMLAFLTATVALSTSALAQTAFTYQGQLRDAGVAVTTPVDVQYRLFDSIVSGSQVGGTLVSSNITPTDGLFQADLDFGADSFNGDPRWLEISVRNPAGSGNFVPLTPRQRVTAAPYATQTRGMSVADNFDVDLVGRFFVDESTGFVGVGRAGRVSTQEFFGIQAPVNSGYGGMYIRTDGDAGQPFYGYSSNGNLAWTYFDGSEDKWHVYNNGIGLTVRDTGAVGIGNTNPIYPLHVSTASSQRGIYATSTFASGSAIQGDNDAASGTGVRGDADGTDGIGVRGTAQAGIGVVGKHEGALGDPGVKGESASSGFGATGVLGELTATNGGQTSAAVRGLNNATDNDGSGVLGQHQGGGYGVQGTSLVGTGVRGFSITGAGVEAYSQSGDIFQASNAGGVVAHIENDGTMVVPVLQITGGSDLCEKFEIRGADVRAGMVVSIDATVAGHLRVSDDSYDRTVAGIVSGANGINPGMLMGQDGSIADGRHPVALTGRVWTWCDSSTGAIEPGDLLTTSSTPGHAMKVSDHAAAQGAVIGKAMTRLAAGETGMVLVLVNLQ